MTSLAAKPRLIDIKSPFDNTRDTRFFYESKAHSEALSRLLYLANDKTMGMGMLTGEIGAGKTLTRTVFANHLDQNEFKVVAIENGLLGFDDLLLEMISQIRGERVRSTDFPDRYSRLSEYKRLLINEIAEYKKHLVIILDEAQQVSDADLDALKGLSNISSERVNFATLILIGQPELRERLRSLPQLDQRVSLRFHINSMDPQEVSSYVLHRLKMSGFRGQIPFTREAVDLIARESHGIPRSINRICKLTLDYSLNHEFERIERSTVQLIAADLKSQSGLSNSPSIFG